VPTELSAGAELGLGPWVWLLLVPLALTLATSFTKATVVLGALRTGMSADALLPGPVVLALALLVTAGVMSPVAMAVAERMQIAGGPDGISTWAAWIDVLTPLREFLERHADPEELTAFSELLDRSIDDPGVLVSAFLVTELTEALAMAVVVLLPFVVVDLLVAQVLVLFGAPAPTAAVALPLKILVFLAAGGWDVIIGGLVEGYA
jgi:flagellar biosynthesis protein FliP